MNWETMGQIVAVASAIGSVFHFAVLRPLNESIIGLKEVAKELKTELQEVRAQHQVLAIEIAKIDQKAKAAHNRLDRFDELIQVWIKEQKA